MKILFVAMADSIHTARWINQIVDQGWDIYLFPSTAQTNLHSEMSKKIKYLRYGWSILESSWIRRLCYIGFSFAMAEKVLNFICDKYVANYQRRELNFLIRRIKPDIIHSLEFQAGGYQVLWTKQNYWGEFPTWIATNWGSDLYLFGQLADHKPILKQLLEGCDYYLCECHRDICLAKSAGLKAQILPVLPNTGGLKFGQIPKWRQKKTSQRKIIMLKGYQNIFGRALVGLRALAKCKNILKGYKVIIFSAAPYSDVTVSAELLTKNYGIPVVIIPNYTPHNEILKLHGQARISIGLSISDAISTSLLEAMAMGSFPIQSNTSCADEWIKNGKSGFIVPPEDPDIIAKAIRSALADDELVDQASKKNFETVKTKLDYGKIKKQVIKYYESIYDNRQVSRVDFLQIMRDIVNSIIRDIVSLIITLILFLWFFICIYLWKN